MPALAATTLSKPDVEPAASLDLGEVYEAHVGYVYRCLRALGVHDGGVEDAVHDVFLVVQRRLGDFEERSPGGLKTWLYAIALRVAGKHRAPRREIGDEVERADPATPESTAERTDAVALVASILEKLDAEKREVFVLAEIEELSAPEIAHATGLKLNTVYSRLRVARAEFRAHVQRARTRTR